MSLGPRWRGFARASQRNRIGGTPGAWFGDPSAWLGIVGLAHGKHAPMYGRHYRRLCGFLVLSLLKYGLRRASEERTEDSLRCPVADYQFVRCARRTATPQEGRDLPDLTHWRSMP